MVDIQKMQTLKIHKRLCAFLVILLLGNSSLALETITHQGHQHATTMEHATYDIDSHDSVQPLVVPLPFTSVMIDGDEDCVCDDICCVSSVQFVAAVTRDKHPGPVDSGLHRIDLYQSIKLDLAVPPPTA
jgi:hypothetical protein|tara:strand:- start:55381 stop:55770 length:390 start_codon:yes stop_codon:yes gene_type:complete